MKCSAAAEPSPAAESAAEFILSGNKDYRTSAQEETGQRYESIFFIRTYTDKKGNKGLLGTWFMCDV